MDSDSGEKYDTSGTEDEEMEPRPLSVAFYKQWHFLDFTTYYGFCISRTITGWLTVMTYYGK
jgi:hypothetical protein